MISIFLNKFYSLIVEVFNYLFGKDDKQLKSVIDLDVSVLKNISRLRTTDTGIYYIFDYNNKIVHDSIHYIKNKNATKLTKKMSLILADSLLEELSEEVNIFNTNDFVIISIPTSRNHWLRRGFNPSDEISKYLAESMNIEYLDNVLIKYKETPEQKILTRTQRLSNVKGSMILNTKINQYITNKSIIVVDDITTTGATLNEARRVLKKNNIKKIICVSLAH